MEYGEVLDAIRRDLDRRGMPSAVFDLVQVPGPWVDGKQQLRVEVVVKLEGENIGGPYR